MYHEAAAPQESSKDEVIIKRKKGLRRKGSSAAATSSSPKKMLVKKSPVLLSPLYSHYEDEQDQIINRLDQQQNCEIDEDTDRNDQNVVIGLPAAFFSCSSSATTAPSSSLLVDSFDGYQEIPLPPPLLASSSPHSSKAVAALPALFNKQISLSEELVESHNNRMQRSAPDRSCCCFRTKEDHEDKNRRTPVVTTKTPASILLVKKADLCASSSHRPQRRRQRRYKQLGGAPENSSFDIIIAHSSDDTTKISSSCAGGDSTTSSKPIVPTVTTGSTSCPPYYSVRFSNVTIIEYDLKDDQNHKQQQQEENQDESPDVIPGAAPGLLRVLDQHHGDKDDANMMKNAVTSDRKKSARLISRLLRPRQQRLGLSTPSSPLVAPPGHLSYNSTSNGDRVCILPIDIYENERPQRFPKFSTCSTRRRNDPVYFYQSRLLLHNRRRRSLLPFIKKKKKRKSKSNKHASLAMKNQKSFFGICSLLPNCIKKNNITGAPRPADIVTSNCDSLRRKDENKKGCSTRIIQNRSERILKKKSPVTSDNNKDKNAATSTIHATSKNSSRYMYY